MGGISFIGPILFIIILASLPFLGFIAGWKNSLFWGGGNLVGYFLGLAILNPITTYFGQYLTIFAPLIRDLGGTVDIEELVKSLSAVFYFALVLTIWNVILIINYFSWFRRIVILRKSTTKKTNKWRAMVSPQKNLLTSIGSSLLFTTLLLPSTFSTASAITISSTTTQDLGKNSFLNGTYKAFLDINNAFNWMSYYKTTSYDFLATRTFNFLKKHLIFYHSLDGEFIHDESLEAIEDVLGRGIHNIFNINIDSEDIEADLLSNVNTFITSWNSINFSISQELVSLFNSTLFGDYIIKQSLEKKESQIMIYDKNINYFIEKDNLFDRAINAYFNNEEFAGAKFKKATIIDVKSNFHQKFANSFSQLFSFDGGISYEQKQNVMQTFYRFTQFIFK